MVKSCLSVIMSLNVGLQCSLLPVAKGESALRVQVYEHFQCVTLLENIWPHYYTRLTLLHVDLSYIRLDVVYL